MTDDEKLEAARFRLLQRACDKIPVVEDDGTIVGYLEHGSYRPLAEPIRQHLVWVS